MWRLKWFNKMLVAQVNDLKFYLQKINLIKLKLKFLCSHLKLDCKSQWKWSERNKKVGKSFTKNK